MKFIRYSSWLIICFCAFALGILVSSFTGLSVVLLIFSLLVSLICFLAFWSRRDIRFLFLALTFFTGGMLRVALLPEPPNFVGGATTLQGIVVHFPRRFEDSVGYRLSIPELHTKVFATAPSTSGFRFGDRVSVRCSWQRNDRTTPFYRNLRIQGVDYTCSNGAITLIEKKANAFYGLLADIREGIQSYSRALFPEPEQSLLMGILLGDRDGFSPEFQAQMREVGVSHITVISGQNIVIVATFLFYGFYYLRLKRLAASVVVIILLGIFSVFVGSDASVLRAVIMYASGMLGYFLERPRLSYYILALTAILMLLANPLILFDVGFILSFAAVFGLMYFTPFWKRHISTRFPEYIRDTLVATLAAQTGVLPFLIFLFGSVSIIAPLTNLLILLVVPYAMGLGLGVLFLPFLSFIPFSATQILAYAAFLPLTYMVTVIEWFSRLPYITLEVTSVWGKGVLLAFVLGIYGLIWQWKRIRQWYEIRFRKKPPEADYEEVVVKLDELLK